MSTQVLLASKLGLRPVGLAQPIREAAQQAVAADCGVLVELEVACKQCRWIAPWTSQAHQHAVEPGRVSAWRRQFFVFHPGVAQAQRMLGDRPELRQTVATRRRPPSANPSV